MGITLQVACALMVGAGWFMLVTGLVAAYRGRARLEEEIRARIEHLPEGVRAELDRVPVARGRAVGALVELGLVLLALVAALMAARPWLDLPWYDRLLESARGVLAVAFLGAAPLVALNLGRPETLVELGPSPLRHLRRALTRPLLTLGGASLALAMAELQRRGEPEAALVVMACATLVALFGLIRERTRLTRPGVRMAGLFCPWDQVDRVVWTDDERGVALRVRLLNRPRWLILPVPEGRSLEVLHALERFVPSSAPLADSSIMGIL
jgi:hypothetical protein